MTQTQLVLLARSIGAGLAFVWLAAMVALIIAALYRN